MSSRVFHVHVERRKEVKLISGLVLTFFLGTAFGSYVTLKLTQSSYPVWTKGIDISRSHELANLSRAEYKKGNLDQALEALVISRYFAERKIETQTPSLYFPYFHSTLENISNNTDTKNTIYLYDCAQSYLRKKVYKPSSPPHQPGSGCDSLAASFLSSSN